MVILSSHWNLPTILCEYYCNWHRYCHCYSHFIDGKLKAQQCYQVSNIDLLFSLQISCAFPYTTHSACDCQLGWMGWKAVCSSWRPPRCCSVRDLCHGAGVPYSKGTKLTSKESAQPAQETTEVLGWSWTSLYAQLCLLKIPAITAALCPTLCWDTT